MIGAHELLLIVRAQNQASAALGRVGADIRRLQRMRDLGVREASAQARIAAQTLKLTQIESSLGTRNLAIQRAQLQIQNQIRFVKDRDVLLEQRRAAIVARGNSLLAQQQRYEDRILGLEGKRASAQASIARAQMQVLATERKIADLSVGGVGRQGAQLTQHRARTQILQTELNAAIARRRLEAIRGSEAAPPYAEPEQLARLEIANRRVAEARRSYAIAAEGVKGLDKEIKILNRTLLGQKEALRATELQLGTLDREEQQIRNDIIRLRDAWNSLSARERAVQGVEAQHARQLAELQLRMKGVQSQAMALGAEAVALRTSLAGLGTEMDAIATERAIQRMERFRTSFAAMSHIGRVAQMGGLIGTAATGFAAIRAAQFQTQSVLAATQARQPGGGVQQTLRLGQQVSNTILAQMQKFPATAQEMQKAIYDIFSGTNIQNMKQAGNLLTVFNKEAVAGQTDLNTMVQAGITLFNNYPRAFKNATVAGNEFFAMVRFGRGNAADFANSLTPIIPIAKQTGQSVREVFGTLAAASRVNPNLRQNAQGYARLLQMIARPDVVAGFKKLGISVTDVNGNVRNLLDIAKEIPQRFKTPLAAINFFKNISEAATGRGTQGTIQAQRFWANLIKNTGMYSKVMQQVNSDTKEFTMSYKALSQQPGVQWQVFTNQLKALVILIGQGAMPTFIRITRFLTRMIEKFNELSPHTKRLVGEIAAVVSIATLLGGTLLTIVGGIGVFVMGLRTVGRMFGIVKGAAVEAEGAVGRGGIIGMLTGAGGRAGLTVGLAAAIPLLIIYHKQVGEIVHALGGLQNTLTLVTGAVLALTFARQIAGMVRLAAEARTAGLAVLATRSALLGMAGLAVTATILIIERHRIESAAKRAFTGSGVPGFDPTLGAHIDPTTGQVVTHFNRGVLGYFESHFGSEATKGVGGFFSRRFHQGQYGSGIQAEAARYRQFARVSGLGLSIATFDKMNAKLKQFDTKIDDSDAKWRRFILDIQGKAGQHIGGGMTTLPLGGLFKVPKVFDATQKATDKSSHANTRHTHTLVQMSRSAQKWIGIIERANKQMLLHPHDLAIATRYETLVAEMNAQFKGQPKLLAAINDVLGNYDSNLKKTTKDTQILKTTSADVVSGIQSMYLSLLQSNQQMMGQLFQGPFMSTPRMQRELQVGYKPTGRDYLRDARSQIRQFRTETGLLNRLAGIGAPPELLNQLEQLDPKDAIAKMRALQQLTPREMKTYFNVLKAQQDLIHKQTMRQLTNQLQDYRKYGKQMALQIIAGIRDANMTPKIRSELKGILGDIFGGSGGSGKGGGGGDNNSVTFNVNVTHDGMSTKAQVEQAAWKAWVQYQRHRHK